MNNRRLCWFQAAVMLLACAGFVPDAGAAEVKPYGFILVNAIQQFGRTNALDVPTQATSRNDQDARITTNNIFARQTRIGLAVEGAKGWRDAALTGMIEADFFGNRGAASNSDVLVTSPRLRLAFIQAAWDKHAVVFGQDWVKAFAPLNPASLMHTMTSPLSTSGNLWNRIPQIRWDAAWTVSRLGDRSSINTKLALLRSFSADQVGNGTVTSADREGSGEFSGHPAPQALIEFVKSTANGKWVIGVSGQYLRQKFRPNIVPPPAGATNNVVGGLMGSVHVILPISSKLEISAEGFTGRSASNLQSLAGNRAYNNNGAVQTPYTRGGFVQAVFKPIKDWRFNGIWGYEKLGEEALAAAAAVRNETYMINANWEWSKEFMWAVEYGQINTLYIGKAAGKSHNVGLAAQYKF